MIDADGTHMHAVTTVSAVYGSPTWSPDGARLAFTDGGADLAVMNVDGTGIHRLFRPSPVCTVGDLSWSPDSARLVFDVSCNGPLLGIPTSIQEIGANGKGRRTLIGTAHPIPSGRCPTSKGARYSSPAWSPDGTRILFVETLPVSQGLISEVCVMSARGAGLRTLTPRIGPGLLAARSFSPVWSPDGAEIVFLQAPLGRGDRFAGEAQLFVMHADGTDPRRIARETGGILYPAWQPIPDASSPPAPSEALFRGMWPVQSQDDLRRAEQRALHGQDRWMLDLNQTALQFARQVLSWDPAQVHGVATPLRGPIRIVRLWDGARTKTFTPDLATTVALDPMRVGTRPPMAPMKRAAVS